MPHHVFSETPQVQKPKRNGSCLEVVAGLLVVAAATAAYFWYFPQQGAMVKNNALNLVAEAFPCGHPETYSLGAFDERFGISQSEFLGAVQKAQQIWETAAGRPLFKLVDTNGALVINLIYDDRQKATDSLRELGVTIDHDKEGYDRLKAEHDALEADYEPKKTSFDAAVAAHDKRVTAYKAQVDAWNAKGGAPREEYRKLNAELLAIDVETGDLNIRRKALNDMVDRINANVTVLNRLASSLNLTAEEYNGVSGSRGAEFEEGLFTGTRAGGKIDIFEFDDKDRLVRLLVHEIGHALGLEHVEESNAIMYRLNKGKNLTPTDADIAELRRVCKL